jgi:hypothetical protein
MLYANPKFDKSDQILLDMGFKKGKREEYSPSDNKPASPAGGGASGEQKQERK